MHDGPKTEQLLASDQDRAIAKVLCRLRQIMEEREAANPTPEPPPEPWVNKPGALIAAERTWRPGSWWRSCSRLSAEVPRDVRRADAGVRDTALSWSG
jgi:hypothetical protein